MGKVILSLLQEPAFFRAAKNPGQPDSHFGRYAGLAVYQFGEGVARHPEGVSRIGNCQPHRLNALLQYDRAGVRWVFHGHGPIPFSGNQRSVLREALPEYSVGCPRVPG